MTHTIVKKPSDCSETELNIFETLVMKGGEVNGVGLRSRIMKAKPLVFLYETDKIVAGVAALKNPHTYYKTNVFKKAETQEIQVILSRGWLDLRRGTISWSKIFPIFARICIGTRWREKPLRYDKGEEQGYATHKSSLWVEAIWKPISIRRRRL